MRERGMVRVKVTKYGAWAMQPWRLVTKLDADASGANTEDKATTSTPIAKSSSHSLSYVLITKLRKIN